MANLVPRDYFGIPTLADIENDLLAFPQTQVANNVTISEDDKNVYVDAAVPGVNPQDIDVTFDHGVLWIRGESQSKEEGKKKKYYSKASTAFSYKIAVPGDVDQKATPQATCDNGVVEVTFPKSAEAAPKKISVKSGKSNGKMKETKTTGK